MTKLRDEKWKEWLDENPHDPSSVAEHFMTEQEFDEGYNKYVRENREPSCFEAGWNACKKHDSDVLALVEALEKTKQVTIDELNEPVRQAFWAANEALTRWRKTNDE